MSSSTRSASTSAASPAVSPAGPPLPAAHDQTPKAQDASVFSLLRNTRDDQYAPLFTLLLEYVGNDRSDATQERIWGVWGKLFEHPDCSSEERGSSFETRLTVYILLVARVQASSESPHLRTLSFGKYLKDRENRLKTLEVERVLIGGDTADDDDTEWEALKGSLGVKCEYDLRELVDVYTQYSHKILDTARNPKLRISATVLLVFMLETFAARTSAWQSAQLVGLLIGLLRAAARDAVNDDQIALEGVSARSFPACLRVVKEALTKVVALHDKSGVCIAPIMPLLLHLPQDNSPESIALRAEEEAKAAKRVKARPPLHPYVVAEFQAFIARVESILEKHYESFY